MPLRNRHQRSPPAAAGQAADGRDRVKAITSPVNSASVAFHATTGFTVTGPVPDHDGPGVDRVVFELRLPPR
ncbi:hypothetical protein [Nonomuraea sp. NPDC049607]|uniref:hypothetical protein n=1 Tax=unclassified Nonomuraea TaxID=2593643 RepID=UPI0034275A6C